MRDLVLEISGAKITFVTGQHSNYPCTNIIRDPDCCWISSGSFPQSFVVSLQQSATIEEIAIESYNAKTVILEGSTSAKPANFQQIGISDLQSTNGTKQLQQIFTNTNSKLAARHLKITITRSYDHFVAVYHLKVIGSSGGTSPAKFSASQMGIGNEPTAKQGTNVEMSNGGFGNSFSTQPIKVENKFESFKALNGATSSNGYSEPKSWESQAATGNENWNHDEVPIPTSAAKWDNDDEQVVYGQNENDASDDDVDTRKTDFDSKGHGNFNQDEGETFQNDDQVQGFARGNDDEDSFRDNKVQW